MNKARVVVVAATIASLTIVGVCLFVTLRSGRAPKVSPPEAAKVKAPSHVPKETVKPSPAPTPALTAERPKRLGKGVSSPIASPAVMVVLGLDVAKNDYTARVKAMRSLTRKLSDDDVRVLMLFLKSDAKVQRTLKPIEFNSLKSDILGVLLGQENVSPDLGGLLLEMYRDRGNDDVWRDYCVQYFAACYETAESTGVTTNESARLREDIRKACEEALAEKDKSIAGTALIAVEQLSRKHTEFDRKAVGETAVALAADDGCGEAARITAVRLCAAMGTKDVVPASRILAQTGESAMLRMAAVATFGDLGEPGDVELLRSLAAGSDGRIVGVASSAVVRLARRLESESVSR